MPAAGANRRRGGFIDKEKPEWKCRNFLGLFIFLMIIDLLELSCGVILRIFPQFSVPLAVRVYILTSRSFILGLIIVILVVWQREAQGETMKKTLIISYNIMTLIDIVVTVLLCIFVYEVRLNADSSC